MVAPARPAAKPARSLKMVQASSHPASQRSPAGLQHGEPLGGKQRRLAGMHADRQHQPVGQPDGLAHHVDMAVGDRVERPGIKTIRGMPAGLARPPPGHQGRDPDRSPVKRLQKFAGSLNLFPGATNIGRPI
jgi:hypothetical protein